MNINLVDKPSKKKRILRWLLGLMIVGGLVGGYLVFRYVLPRLGRWQHYWEYIRDPGSQSEAYLQAGQLCDNAPFATPTSGVVFGLWDESYRPGHRHQGIDIFAGTEPGITPIYAAYPGYLTRQADWVSTIIIRIPDDPLSPGRQIWTYYTHMADVDGNTFISEQFPPGTSEVFVEVGTLLGYQGNYSGSPDTPTGLHLHFSIVLDDGQGGYRNELEIGNTVDPSLYFNLPLNFWKNRSDFPTCGGTVIYAPGFPVPED